MTAPERPGAECLTDRAMQAADEAADRQYPGDDGVAAQLRGEHAHGYHNGYLAAAKAEVIRELEAMVPKVCEACKREREHIGCLAAPLHARIAELKGEA